MKMAVLKGQREVVDLITTSYATQNNLIKEVQIVFSQSPQAPSAHRASSGAPGGGSAGQPDPSA